MRTFANSKYQIIPFMRTLFFTLSLIIPLMLSAQSLTLHWHLVQNDPEPGLVESQLTLTNHTADTLTADGGWLIGYCWMSVHPYTFEGAELEETEVCATYHTLKPTAAFRPLAPGESRQYRLLQKGGIIRESAGPEGAFFVKTPGAKPLDMAVSNDKFTSPLQWTRKNNPGYADGEFMYSYNAPFCEPLNEDEKALRPLQLVPYPKDVKIGKGICRVGKARVVTKFNPNLPKEGYTLTIKAKKIIIESADQNGYLYAMQTFQQLLRQANVPQMVITDYPDFPHRGLMLDIARNYLPKEEVLHILDLMALYKLNVLHFHIVDDEAWRVEIPGLPELTEVGSRRGYTTDEHDCLYPAYCGGWNPEAAATANGYLRQRDYIDIVHHASLLGIQVIPEIDMPGHSRAAIRSMEERYRRLLPQSAEAAWEYRLADPDDKSVYSSAQYYTDDVICIALPGCYRFVEKVLTELARMHQEAGQPLKVFHVGGDEVAKGAWIGSPLCQQFMKEQNLSDTHELKDYFLQRVLDIMRPMGIKIGGWEEIAMRGGEVNPRFAGDDVISWCWNSIPEWRGDEKPYKLANAGYPVVLACVGNLYLDMSYTNHQAERALHWGGYTDEHSTFDFLPYDIYRSVRYTMKRELRNIDEYDQNKTLRLQPEAQQKLYGIQGQIFAETLRSSDQLEEYIVPKIFGLAERAWNATPISYQHASSLDSGREAFEKERRIFSEQVYHELEQLKGYSFHLAQPGIHVENRLIYMNHPCQEAVIRYTLDGSEPTEESSIYSAPIPQQDGAIRAKAFFLGKESATTQW